jgi:hypothetical protein
MTEYQDVFDYITAEKNNYRTARVPLTNSKDWNMYDHVERCTNVANAWFNKGNNDGLRPYNDIVTPIIDVAFRSEGFDVKDIVPYVNDSDNYYKSFLVKKYHPKWARKNELDTFIDEVVETSIIYDLVIVKNINNARPEVIDLKSIAFCNQVDVSSGPLCLQHDYSVAELTEFKGKWDSDAIDLAIIASTEDRKVPLANDAPAKLPSKNIECFELRGNLPEKWLDEDGDVNKYVPSMYIVCFYTDTDGNKQGITLFKGKDKPLKDNFKFLKIDGVRSKGRACGRSVVERLFEPQVWSNYAGIKIKELLDSAINVLVTDSEELRNQKLSDLKNNTILHQEKGANTSRLDGTLQNLPSMVQHQQYQEEQARLLGSASEGSLGQNPTSGTPFALQNLIVQEGQGIHEYRQGKIATFFADVLYRDFILGYLVREMNAGQTFNEELSMDEMLEISEKISSNQAEREIMDLILDGKIPTPEVREELIKIKKEAFMKGGSRKFMEVVKGELDSLPVDVLINIKGKQKKMAQNADKITNIIREIVANPQAFQQIPGIGKAFNELLEESGLSAIDFSQIITPEDSPVAQADQANTPQTPQAPQEQLPTPQITQ